MSFRSAWSETEVHFEKWALDRAILSIRAFDIGVMPLSDTTWNRVKCGFKAIEYMALGVATVASPVGMLKHLIRHGENGFLATMETEWVESLRTLIEDATLRARVRCRRETHDRGSLLRRRSSPGPENRSGTSISLGTRLGCVRRHRRPRAIGHRGDPLFDFERDVPEREAAPYRLRAVDPVSAAQKECRAGVWVHAGERVGVAREVTVERWREAAVRERNDTTALEPHFAYEA